MRQRALALTAVATVLAGCAGGVELLPRSAAVPAGVDFTGLWQLRETTGITQPRARGLLVHAFLETGVSVRITQTDAGLFLSFDRSVVEEYRFGENREVRIGEVTARRVSGWENTAYVVETLDRDDNRLVDTYRLRQGGDALARSIVLWSGNAQVVALEQVFDRQERSGL